MIHRSIERGDTIVLQLLWAGHGGKTKKYRVRNPDASRGWLMDPRRWSQRGAVRARICTFQSGEHGSRATTPLGGGGEWTKWEDADDMEYVRIHYERVRVADNGDCMFAAVALANQFLYASADDLDDSWSNGDALQKATDALRQNANDIVCTERQITSKYAPYVEKEWKNKTGDVVKSSDEEYCQRLALTARKARGLGLPDGAVFGTLAEMNALSYIIQRRIHIYDNNMKLVTVCPIEGHWFANQVPVRVVFHAKHYDALVRMTAPNHRKMNKKKPRKEYEAKCETKCKTNSPNVCSHCTFINDDEKSSCAICEKPLQERGVSSMDMK